MHPVVSPDKSTDSDPLSSKPFEIGTPGRDAQASLATFAGIVPNWGGM